MSAENGSRWRRDSVEEFKICSDSTAVQIIFTLIICWQNFRCEIVNNSRLCSAGRKHSQFQSTFLYPEMFSDLTSQAPSLSWLCFHDRLMFKTQTWRFLLFFSTLLPNALLCSPFLFLQQLETSSKTLLIAEQQCLWWKTFPNTQIHPPLPVCDPQEWACFVNRLTNDR